MSATPPSAIGAMLYHQQRYLIVSAARSGQSVVSDAEAYAWTTEVYPAAHSSSAIDAFEPYFAVGKSKVEPFFTALDQDWRNKKVHTFYNLEDMGSRRGKGITSGWDRAELIHFFRYVFLNGGFDQNFWSTLLKPTDHPAEAAGVTRPFVATDLFW